mmetsp:Transcript_17930/g.18590  ORF Transcript_17930/g.18590 Transcript_17930/m.18590 type:complete len:177 (+) Transcript_17930:15-545(+)
MKTLICKITIISILILSSSFSQFNSVKLSSSYESLKSDTGPITHKKVKPEERTLTNEKAAKTPSDTYVPSAEEVIVARPSENSILHSNEHNAEHIHEFKPLEPALFQASNEETYTKPQPNTDDNETERKESKDLEKEKDNKTPATQKHRKPNVSSVSLESGSNNPTLKYNTKEKLV